MNAGMMQRAIDLAEQVHADQMYGKEPFIEHVRAVLKCVQETSSDPLDHIVAILHDVVEDSNGKVTVAYLRQEFGEEVAVAMDHISRRKGEPYGDYIRRIPGDVRAIRVKLCDLSCNVYNLLHVDPNSPKRGNLPRYHKARSYLTVQLDQARKMVFA